MSATVSSHSNEPTPPDDLTGRDRIAWNVLVSWGGQLVFLAAGFFMPRLIDTHLGQHMLGIWDFCWSIIATVSYSSLGVGSSTNRYVAKYRAARDVLGIRRATSSVFFVELALGGVALLLTLLASLLVPILMRDQLGVERYMVAGLIALLGASVSVQIGLEVFRGTITGCHRWDLHNLIGSGSYGIIVAAMAGVLLSGGGLLGLAAVYFTGTVMTEIIRALIAYRVCPELRIRAAYAEWGQARSMLKFGAKSFLESLAAIILGAGGALLITTYLGPSALAVFSRPSGLVRNAGSFVAKFANVLTPTASALHGGGHTEELGHFLIETTRQAVCLALPSMLFLAIMGEPILHLWMGSRYAEGLLLAVMALCAVPVLVQAPAMTILMGMNMHGRMAILMNTMALCGLGLASVVLRDLGWGLVATSVIMVAPLLIVQGIVLPIYTCRRIGVPLWYYLKNGFVGPIACALPFGICAAIARLLFEHRPLLAILVGGVAGGLTMAPLYWYFVLSRGTRRQVVASVVRRLPAALSTASDAHPSSMDRE